MSYYRVPPAHYQSSPDYSSPYSQYASDNYVHYVPAYNTATPTKGHARKHSFAESPRSGGYYSPGHANYTYYTPRQETYDQVRPDDTPRKTRARASTGTSKTTPKHRSQQSTSSPAVASEKDAERAGIPRGYSIKNWDPTEKPIILLGSVFDANSLGKWIYDWTVFHHGASSPMADMAGDLWLLLIKLAGKTKRAEDCIRTVKNADSRDMLQDFLSSGVRLWDKFKDVLKDCESDMLKAAKKEGKKTLGDKAGIAFVDSMFGYTEQHDKTAQIMQSIRLWNMRFDVNCEDILRRPNAS